MLPKKAAGLIAPGKLKGKLKGKAKPATGTPTTPPGPPQAQGTKPVLKAGASKKLKGMG